MLERLYTWRMLGFWLTLTWVFATPHHPSQASSWLVSALLAAGITLVMTVEPETDSSQLPTILILMTAFSIATANTPLLWRIPVIALADISIWGLHWRLCRAAAKKTSLPRSGEKKLDRSL